MRVKAKPHLCALLGHDWSAWLPEWFYDPEGPVRGEYRRCHRCYMEEWR